MLVSEEEFAVSPYDEPLDHLPAWLFLLDPLERGWREKQLLKGRDPDSHIEAETHSRW